MLCASASSVSSLRSNQLKTCLVASPSGYDSVCAQFNSGQVVEPTSYAYDDLFWDVTRVNGSTNDNQLLRVCVQGRRTHLNTPSLTVKTERSHPTKSAIVGWHRSFVTACEDRCPGAGSRAVTKRTVPSNMCSAFSTYV